jgi:hypothetical protein
MKTVLARKEERIITYMHILDDKETEEIKRLCATQHFEVLATNKPDGYSISDGWSEFNIHSAIEGE